MRKSPSAFFSAPILFFLFSEKEKSRRSVRRSLLHSASAGAAKAPYSQSPSSSPKGNRFAGLPFGFVGADDAVEGRCGGILATSESTVKHQEERSMKKRRICGVFTLRICHFLPKERQGFPASLLRDAPEL